MERFVCTVLQKLRSIVESRIELRVRREVSLRGLREMTPLDCTRGVTRYSAVEETPHVEHSGSVSAEPTRVCDRDRGRRRSGANLVRLKPGRKEQPIASATSVGR
jgi:hypothetical protein